MNIYQRKIAKNAKHIRKYYSVSWNRAKKISRRLLNWLINGRGFHAFIGIDLAKGPDKTAYRTPIGIIRDSAV